MRHGSQEQEMACKTHQRRLTAEVLLFVLSGAAAHVDPTIRHEVDETDRCERRDARTTVSTQNNRREKNDGRVIGRVVSAPSKTYVDLYSLSLLRVSFSFTSVSQQSFFCQLTRFTSCVHDVPQRTSAAITKNTSSSSWIEASWFWSARGASSCFSCALLTTPCVLVQCHTSRTSSVREPALAEAGDLTNHDTKHVH